MSVVQTKYMPDGKKYGRRGEQTLHMECEGNAIAYLLNSTLINSASNKKEMDKWDVTITSGGKTENFLYSTGTGHRTTIHRLTGDVIPTQPLAVDVMQSLGSDIITFINLPHDESKALDEIASEFGYNKPSECLDILRSLRSNADKISNLISGNITLSDFVDWTNSYQMNVNSRKDIIINLPEVLRDGEVFVGHIAVSASTAQTNSRSTALEPVGENNMTISSRCKVYGRKETDKFSSESSSSIEDVDGLWGHIPEIKRVVEILNDYSGNGLHAGTEAQSALIASMTSKEDKFSYDKIVAILKEHNLLVDNDYSYGSAWLVKVIPADVVDEIKNFKTMVIEVDNTKSPSP